MAEAFLLLACLAVVASTRTWPRLAATVAAGVGSLALWLVPLSWAQPGGLSTWLRATRTETSGAYQTGSILVSGTGGATNFGTFAAYAVLTFGPLLLLGLAALVTLAVHRAGRPDGAGPHGDLDALRPWYQRTGVVLTTAIVPPLAIVNLVEFAKGGYELAYLPTVAILLLWPVGGLVRKLGRRSAVAVTTVAVLVVVAVTGLNTQRFTAGRGIVPIVVQRHLPGLWISQARFGAPFVETAATIRASDAADGAFRRLAGIVHPDIDVVVLVSYENGLWPYRNIDWAVPQVRVALDFPPAITYQEQGGLLYYDAGAQVRVGPGGYAYFLVTSEHPEMSALAPEGLASFTGLVIDGFQVWRVSPGAQLFEVTVVAVPGPRPLGKGI
jgi:hypothetical protein